MHFFVNTVTFSQEVQMAIRSKLLDSDTLGVPESHLCVDQSAFVRKFLRRCNFVSSFAHASPSNRSVRGTCLLPPHAFWILYVWFCELMIRVPSWWWAARAEKSEHRQQACRPHEWHWPPA